jgi:hypothetical protein
VKVVAARRLIAMASSRLKWFLLFRLLGTTLTKKPCAEEDHHKP